MCCVNFLNKSPCSYFADAQKRFACNVGASILQRATIGFVLSPIKEIIHESGHAIAAYLLYDNSNPEIKLHGYGYWGGNCSIDSSVLSKIGEVLGPHNSMALFCAAGPVAEMTTSVALLYFFPGNSYSFQALLSNANYALRALEKKEFYSDNIVPFNGHDFVGVKIYKGSVAAGALITISVALAFFAIYSVIYNSL